MRQRRVGITGIGVIAPSGIGKDAFWRATRAGENHVSDITRFDARAYRCRVAGEVADFEPTAFMPARLARKLDRFSQLVLGATDLALRDAAIDLTKEDRERVGIVLGNCLGGWEFAERELRNLYVSGPKEVSPYLATAWFPAAPQGQISILHGIKGYAKTIVADIASGLVAIGTAARAVRAGVADVVLAGGCEAPIAPYAMLCCSTNAGLASSADPTAYRPFDRRRCGFVPGEGAAVFTVEELERARARGARVYAEVTGFATTADGQHATDYEPTGRHYARAMRSALERAGVRPTQVHYLGADALGTPDADAIEAAAIRQVFDGYASDLPVTATKSGIGNLLGASGAVELAAALLAMRDGVLPPTVNHRERDPRCDLTVVSEAGRRRDIVTAMVNSRGQGGVSASLVVQKYRTTTPGSDMRSRIRNRQMTESEA